MVYRDDRFKREFNKIKQTLSSSQPKESVNHLIVNLPFEYKYLTAYLDLGIIVLLLVDEQKQSLNRVALSNTRQAEQAVKVSAKPFHDITIPMIADKNIIVKAVKTKVCTLTDDWSELFLPDLTPEEARLNQFAAGIESSLVCPLPQHNGALIFSLYCPIKNLEDYHRNFGHEYTELASELLTNVNNTSQIVTRQRSLPNQ